MDIFQNQNGGMNNLIYEVQHARHGNSKPTKSGGSNYQFADGSARYIRFGGDAWPLCMWAVSAQSQQQYAVPVTELWVPGMPD